MVDSAKGSVTIRSQALRPLVFVVPSSITAGCLMMKFSGVVWMQAFGAALAAVPLAFMLWQYHYFARKDPDRLGSEAFVTQSRVIKYAEKAKNPAILAAMPELMEDPAPPAPKQIGAGGAATDEESNS